MDIKTFNVIKKDILFLEKSLKNLRFIVPQLLYKKAEKIRTTLEKEVYTITMLPSSPDKTVQIYIDSSNFEERMDEIKEVLKAFADDNGIFLRYDVKRCI